MRLAPLLLLVVAGLIGPAAHARADRAHYRYDLRGRPALTVLTRDADVRIRPGDRGQIEIEVTTVGWDIGLGGVTIREDQDGDDVQFEVREPVFRGFRPWQPARRVTVEIVAPTDLDLELVTGDGAVRLAGLSGRLNVRTGDGPLHAESLRGNLVLETGDGAIEARDLEGRLDAHTGDGRITVSGRFDELRLHTGDGSMEVSVDPGSRIEDGWRITSGDGPVLLRLPDDLQADLEASTGDGAISTDLPLSMRGRISKRAIHGSLNGGGGRIALRTGDGSIRIVSR